MKIGIILSILLLANLAQAERFVLDTEKSKIEWKAGKKIGSFHTGAIKIKGGEVETNKKGNVDKMKIDVDMATISNTDLTDDKEKEKLVGHLSGDDFFKVAAHPTSTFELSSVKPVEGSKDKFNVKGKLTMLGKSNDIEFPATIKNDGKTISGDATIEVERLKWGIEYGSGSIFKTLTLNRIINDKFELKLDLYAAKK